MGAGRRMVWGGVGQVGQAGIGGRHGGSSNGACSGVAHGAGVGVAGKGRVVVGGRDGTGRWGRSVGVGDPPSIPASQPCLCRKKSTHGRTEKGEMKVEQREEGQNGSVRMLPSCLLPLSVRQTILLPVFERRRRVLVEDQ